MDLSKIDLSQVDIYADDPQVTPEYMAAVMLASKAGMPIECRHIGHDDWSFCSQDWKEISWAWSALVYRVIPGSKPKKTVPWDSADDVPMPICWIRSANGDALVIAKCGIWLKLCTNGCQPIIVDCQLKDLVACSYSTDGKEWKPCTKEVQS